MRSKMFTIDDNMTIGEFGTMIVLCDELDIIPIETDIIEIRFSVCCNPANDSLKNNVDLLQTDSI